MKRKNILILCGLLVLCSCNNNNTSNDTSNNNQSEFNLNNALLELSSSNITYHTDYDIYYYEIGNASSQESILHYDVIVKFDTDRYQLIAYNYGTKDIASYSNLTKDDEGYVVSQEIGIGNVVVESRVVDGNNNKFKWSDSVYINSLGNFTSADFSLSDDGQSYLYNGNVTDDKIMNVVHGAIPTSYFDTGSVELFAEEGKISKIVIKEVESDEVYENCMYGRSLSLTFSDIGTTKVDVVTKYPESEDNDDLGIAITEMSGLNNYTINIDIIINDQVQKVSKKLITEKDVVIASYDNEEISYSGFHTYEDELYTFQNIDNILYGTKYMSNSFRLLKPSYFFSKDIFKYDGVNEEGYKCYSLDPSMSEVLNYVDFASGYSETYYPSDTRITFFVKDAHLHYITFPTYSFIDGEVVVATFKITYDNFNTTVIEDNFFDNFILNIPSTDLNWSSNLLKADFSFSDDDNDHKMLLIEDIFKASIGENYNIPYFLPTQYIYEDITGNYSSKDNCVYLSLATSNVITNNEYSAIEKALEEAGFEGDGLMQDGTMSMNMFYRDDIEISVLFDTKDKVTIIDFTLPVGNILTLK